MKISWRPLRKIVAAALSGVTATGVVAFLAESGVDVPASVGALVTAAAAVVAGYLVPEPERP
jgi:hypothetical protein